MDIIEVIDTVTISLQPMQFRKASYIAIYFAHRLALATVAFTQIQLHATGCMHIHSLSHLQDVIPNLVVYIFSIAQAYTYIKSHVQGMRNIC